MSSTSKKCPPDVVRARLATCCSCTSSTMSRRRQRLMGVVVVMCSWVWATQAHQSNAPAAYSDGGSSPLQPIRVSQGAGRQVTLHCGDRPTEHSRPNRRGFKAHNVIWHYKRCGRGKRMRPCQDPSLPNEWVVLPCGSRVGCKPALDLGKATSNSNGIYRCSLRNKSPVVPKILTTFVLDIWDHPPEMDMIPDVLNEPDVDMEPPAQPVHMLRPAGLHVELQCRVQGPRKQHAVVWHYKPCSNNFKMPPCSEYASEHDLADWQLVTCGGKSCSNHTLNLTSPAEDDNGLYRCSLRGSGAAIVVTYELEVVEKANSTAEILGNSSRNMTVFSGQPAAFQCRVFSKLSPKIMWFRQRDIKDFPDDIKFIVYINDTFYEQKVSHQVRFPHEIYLNKFVIPSARVADSGLYICVALNNFGMAQRLVYLTVLPKYFQNDMSESEASTSHHWLFLIPAVLAMIPISVWLCCRWRRKKRRCLEAESLAAAVAVQQQQLCQQHWHHLQQDGDDSSSKLEQ